MATRPAARVPVFDDHVHLRADGRFLEAAKEYEAAGGTHFMLVHSPHADFDGAAPDWERSFQRTVDTVAKVRAATGLRCWAVVGPYPVHLVRMAETLGLEEGARHMIEGAEVAARFVAEGKAVAMGEVGRPHFEVSPEVWEASNQVLLRILMVARQAVCPVQLHTESADPGVMQDLAAMARKAGLPLEKTVKHYSAPLVLPEENHGLVPSIIASRSHLRRAAELAPGGRFFFETDYIDDPGRPNVVMPVDTIPKRVAGFLQSGDFTPELLHRSGVEWVERVYGVETGF